MPRVAKQQAGYSVSELSALIGHSRQHVRDLIRSGVLPHVRDARGYFHISEAAAQRLIERIAASAVERDLARSRRAR